MKNVVASGIVQPTELTIYTLFTIHLQPRSLGSCDGPPVHEQWCYEHHRAHGQI